jgi:hypothetical protein
MARASFQSILSILKFGLCYRIIRVIGFDFWLLSTWNIRSCGITVLGLSIDCVLFIDREPMYIYYHIVQSQRCILVTDNEISTKRQQEGTIAREYSGLYKEELSGGWVD